MGTLSLSLCRHTSLISRGESRERRLRPATSSGEAEPERSSRQSAASLPTESSTSHLSSVHRLSLPGAVGSSASPNRERSPSKDLFRSLYTPTTAPRLTEARSRCRLQTGRTSSTPTPGPPAAPVLKPRRPRRDRDPNCARSLPPALISSSPPPNTHLSLPR